MSRDTNKSGKQQTNEPKMVNTDLFTLTYGALISDLLGDLESAEEVNRQLDKIGYNMGQRMADDFLAKNPRVGKCSDIQQIMEIVVKSGFKTYLGLPAQINPYGNNGDEFSILFDPNPLVELIEKPTELKGLCYSQLICGCIRGALEALHMEVQVVLTADSPDPTEMRVKFHRVLHESLPAGDEL